MSKHIDDALKLILEEIQSQEETRKIKDRSKKRGISHRKIDLSHFNLFIRDYNLVPGKNKILPKELAYLYYKDWKRISDIDKASWFILFREIGKSLPRKRWGRKRYYETEIQVTEEIKEKAKEYFEGVRKIQTYERRRNAKKVPIYW